MSESTELVTAAATELVTVTQRRIQCRHVHLAGRQCGSPALRREHFCYFHHATRRRKALPGKFRHLDAHEPFELPVVEDRASALSVASQILSRIASNDLDPTRAGRLLYNLQVVASLLPRPNRTSNPNPNSSLDEIAHEPLLVEELIDDEIHGPIAPITEYLPPAPNPVILSEEHRDESKDPEASHPTSTVRPIQPQPSESTPPPPAEPCKDYDQYTTAEANYLRMTVVLGRLPITPRPTTLTHQQVQNHLNARRKQHNLPPKHLELPPTNDPHPATENPQPATIPTLQAAAAPPPLHWKMNVHANRSSRPHPARLSHRSRRQVHLAPLRPARRPR